MKTNIREYAEEISVGIIHHKERLVIQAINQGGHDCTYVDLVDVINFVKRNMPELLME